MSIFGTIMSKLGLGKKEEAPAVQETPVVAEAAPAVNRTVKLSQMTE